MAASAGESWCSLFRTVETATIVHADLTVNPSHESVALTWLNQEERARRDRYLYPGPQRRFALCRAALRSIICSQLGCKNEELDFTASRHGKPSALVNGTQAPISFNVSHSGRHGLIAFAPEGRLGVDIEHRDGHRNLDLLVASAFGEEEQAELALTRGRERIQLFFKLWTIKEALIKAHGLGFALDTSSFDIPRAMLRGVSKGTFQLAQMPDVRWLLEDLGDERFAAAIAYELDRVNGSERSAA